MGLSWLICEIKISGGAYLHVPNDICMSQSVDFVGYSGIAACPMLRLRLAQSGSDETDYIAPFLVRLTGPADHYKRHVQRASDRHRLSLDPLSGLPEQREGGH